MSGPPQGTGGVDTPFGHLRPRRVILVLVVALILGGGVYALIGRIGDAGDLWEAVERADWPWLIPCAIGLLLSYAGYVVSYRDTAMAFDGPRLPVPIVVRVVMTGFGAFTIGTSAGGLAVDWWAMNRAGLGAGDAAQRVLALNTLQWLSLCLATAAASAALLLGVGSQIPTWLAITWIVVVALALIASAWVSSPKRRDVLSRVDGVRGIRAAFGAAIGGVVIVRRLVLEPTKHPLALLGYPIYWFGDGLCLYAGLAAFGPAPDVLDLIIAYTTGYIAVALPLPAGGAGGVDAAMVGMLTVVGVDLQQALLGVAVYRLFTFWLPIAPALAVVPTLPGLARELDAIAAARGARATEPVLSTS